MEMRHNMTDNSQPEIVNKQDFKVIGIKTRGNNEGGELKAVWEQFNERAQELRAVVTGDAFGLMDNFDYENGEFDYLAGMEVESDEEVPDGMEVWQVLAQNYAVFPARLSNLMDAYRATESWLSSSPYRRAPGPEFERYGEEFDPGDPESPLHLYIPVEPLAGGE